MTIGENTNCEEFEELVSAANDGELTCTETDWLNEHVAVCESCSSRMDAFRKIDELAATRVEFSLPEFDDLKTTLTKPLSKPVNRQVTSSPKWWQVVSAMAAAVVIGLSASMLLQRPKVEDEGFQKPLAILEVIHQQTEQDHKAMLKTLQWELRALKLEARNAELSASESQHFNEKIQALLDRIHLTGR